jgi:hypothetical protein
MGDNVKRAWASIVLFIFSLLSYSPLATNIDAYANNATVTNAVWVFMDNVFPLFWSVFTIIWLVVALMAIFKEMGYL